MFERERLITPVGDLRNIDPKYRNIIKKDVGSIKGRNVFKIKVDIFEESKIRELETNLNKVFSKYVDSKKTLESIKNANDIWKKCLKKAKGDVEKAILIYESRHALDQEK